MHIHANTAVLSNPPISKSEGWGNENEGVITILTPIGVAVTE